MDVQYLDRMTGISVKYHEWITDERHDPYTRSLCDFRCTVRPVSNATNYRPKTALKRLIDRWIVKRNVGEYFVEILESFFGITTLMQGGVSRKSC